MVTVGGLARVAMDYDEQNNYNFNTATFGITQFTFFFHAYLLIIIIPKLQWKEETPSLAYTLLPFNIKQSDPDHSVAFKAHTAGLE